LFRFLSRRTDSTFTKTVLRRLISSRTNRPPLSLSKLIKHLGSKADRTAVVVGTVTEDIRVLDMPKLNVAALRFTEAARARITKAGGKCMTLDELVMQAPTGKWSPNSILAPKALNVIQSAQKPLLPYLSRVNSKIKL